MSQDVFVILIAFSVISIPLMLAFLSWLSDMPSPFSEWEVVESNLRDTRRARNSEKRVSLQNEPNRNYSTGGQTRARNPVVIPNVAPRQDDEEIRFERHLLMISFGDRGRMERLIQVEQEKLTNMSRKECIHAAIEKWMQENR